MTKFNHFPSIEGFHNVRKAIAKYGWLDEHHSVSYRAKVKLHGTNAGILITPDGKVLPQSRTRIISVGEDNMNFAHWVEETKDYWQDFAGQVDMTVFGEWFGKGIMKGVACSGLDEKHFAVFAIQFGPSTPDGAESEGTYILHHPNYIQELLIDEKTPKNIHVLPYYGETLSINFFNEETLVSNVDILNGMVEDVEKEDPWIKEVFDVEGTGEGLVLYPYFSQETIDREDFKKFVFKVKGEKHKVVKQKKAVQLDPEVAASVDAFVDMVLTDARLEQAVREVNRGEFEFNTKLIGPFIGWIGQDVKKETQEELSASGLDWKVVNKELVNQARGWYMKKLEEI